jgi:uncharacterized membrane-anchored protein YjiN (DUF445 family)
MKNKESEDLQGDEYKNKFLFTEQEISKDGKNIVSLEEAILVNSDEVKKKQLIKFLETKDTYKNIDLLKLAVRDKDMETAHYAAVALVDMKKNLDVKMQYLSKEYEKNINKTEVLVEYTNALKEYLDSNLLDDYYKVSHRKFYIEMLEKLLLKQKTEENYNNLIDCLIALKDFNKTKKYCEEYIENFKCEDSYLKRLNYDYMINDKEGFYGNYKSLKQSDIKLSKKGIDIIRFWNLEEIAE